MASATSCPSCSAVIPSGAAFCEMCGASLASGKTQSAQRILTPEAGIVLRRAGGHAQHIAKTLGPEKIMALAGGFLGLLGAFLPFYRVDAQVFIGAIDLARINLPTPSLAHAGGLGAIVILAAVALAVAPFITLPTRAVSLVGFGLAATVFGMVLGDFLRSSMFGRTFAAGFDYTLIGFALLCCVYARRAYAAPS